MLKPIRTRLAIAALTAALLPTAALAQTDAILGTWQTTDGNLVIEVYDAGQSYAARMLHGALVVEADGTTFKKDTMNPDPALRSRSLEGIDFVSGLTWDSSDNRWEDGRIYQAATGQTASARVTIEGDTLNLRAYRGTPLAGRTIAFQRRAN
ncbi:DUF2147 domain-containing protein [Fertoebacter nigrum]|uniref:DUF2147 domain-containing protein n=1 Tax=Fertoeibacter niger TaxID=2656921 RepID=A0A8X8KQ18_9RHOB|nr:DUF2147 domain-containing protein [Fertoeibacter niger]NUB45486.1 DUF2147 domain-containing protein [Fertoeibacter niger]